MCGIYFVAGENAKSVSEKNIKEILSKRGADHFGSWGKTDSPVRIYHSRLSIIDQTENGNQPMIFGKDESILAFNGEIFNFQELKEREFKFENFRGNSDTELLLKLLCNFDIDSVLEMISGQYAFVFYQKLQNKITITRDFYGEKPLFISIESNNLEVSSDLRLMAGKKIDNLYLQELLSHGYSSGSKTIYSNIRQVNPGEIIEIEINELGKVISYKSNQKSYKKVSRPKPILDSNYSEIEKTIKHSVTQMSLADASVGILLSGGVDSTIIAMNADPDKTSKLITATFKGYNEAEVEVASMTAKLVGIDHEIVVIEEEDIVSFINKEFKDNNELFLDSSCIPFYLICNKAKKMGIKVVLTGDGGDELFYGYNRYKAWEIRNNNIVRFMIAAFGNKNIREIINSYVLLSNYPEKQQKIHRINQLIDVDNVDDYYKKITSIPNNSSILEIPPAVMECVKYNNHFDEIKKIRNADIAAYMRNDILVKVDKYSMLAGIEARSPFLSRNLQTLVDAYPIKAIKNKEPLKKILKSNGFQHVLSMKKTGFSAPMANYLRTFLKDEAKNALLNLDKYGLDFYNRENALQALKIHCEDIQKDYSKFLWGCIVVNNWLEKNA